MTLKQLSTKIYNAVKAYWKKFLKDVRDLQLEAIKFDEEYKQYLEDK